MALAAPDDPRLAPYAHVGDPAWLRRHALVVAEGRMVVGRAIGSGCCRLASVVVTPAARAALAGQLAGLDAEVIECAPAVLQAVTGFNFHRGCLALLHRPAAPALATLAASAPLLVGLAGVGNPDNVGGIFRSAAAFGVSGILIGPRTADPFYRKALRTSMGAVFDVPWTMCEDWSSALAALRQQGFLVAAFTPSSGARPLAELAARREPRLVLLFGAEGDGLPAETLRDADLLVRIPIASAVDSLNVGVAAAIALHQLAR